MVKHGARRRQQFVTSLSHAAALLFQLVDSSGRGRPPAHALDLVPEGVDPRSRARNRAHEGVDPFGEKNFFRQAGVDPAGEKNFRFRARVDPLQCDEIVEVLGVDPG